MSSSRDDNAPCRDQPVAHDAPVSPTGRAPRVWLAELEPALASLLAEWLAEAGMCVLTGPEADEVDLLVVGVPFPRLGMPAPVHGLVAQCPKAPVLALSGTLLGSVATHGAVAKALGVSSLLATPIGRDAWLAEVKRLLGRAA